MQAGERLSIEEMQTFLDASEAVEFEGRERMEIYAWVERLLRAQRYEQLARTAKGVVRQYAQKMTGLSRAQVTRLIGQYQSGKEMKPKRYRRNRFPTRYSRADIELLAAVDEAHETLSGPATRKVLEREFHDYGDARYQRRAGLSVAQLYRMRKTRVYRQRRLVYQPTKPAAVAIGERKRPQPEGRPGFLRVDSVHQGDLDGVKGVYHINAVDEVTQWQVVGAVSQISEAALEPVLESMLGEFPFLIRGFHSDNGSEYINYTVAKLLNKLLIEQTNSRPRHSNDNGLVESKNGAVIRKHMGYGYIASWNAQAIGAFYREHLNPYLNFHRPCGVPEIVANAKGKQRRVYRWYATPWQILRHLPGIASDLKPDVTIESLDRVARLNSDTAAASEMQQAKAKLFSALRHRTA